MLCDITLFLFFQLICKSQATKVNTSDWVQGYPCYNYNNSNKVCWSFSVKKIAGTSIIICFYILLNSICHDPMIWSRNPGKVKQGLSFWFAVSIEQNMVRFWFAVWLAQNSSHQKTSVLYMFCEIIFNLFDYIGLFFDSRNHML